MSDYTRREDAIEDINQGRLTRLIDADAKIMVQLYDDEHEDWILKEMTVADYLSFSDTSIPFIDAVPVVRCRDCKHWRSHRGRCYKHDEYGMLSDNFCSYGERREG